MHFFGFGSWLVDIDYLSDSVLTVDSQIIKYILRNPLKVYL